MGFRIKTSGYLSIIRESRGYANEGFAYRDRHTEHLSVQNVHKIGLFVCRGHKYYLNIMIVVMWYALLTLKVTLSTDPEKNNSKKIFVIFFMEILKI